jgi:DNA-binding NarL/FixJ family response regulator
MTTTRVLVADGLAFFSAGVKNVLASEPGFEVTAAQTLEEAARLVALDPPDVALIDLDLPPNGGIAAVVHLADVDPAVRTIVWSLDPSRELVLHAIRSGASGFLHKGVSPTGLVRALQGIKRGEAPLSRTLAQLMIEALHGLDDRARARDRAGRLSVRELEVLEMIARGARNREIANVLTISEFTVKRHVQNILHKLDLASRTAAGAFYRSTVEQPASHSLQGANA